MSEKFQKGDRVRVEFEGVVGATLSRSLQVEVDGRFASVPNSITPTLIERPGEPLAPGSVVRNRYGAIWLVEEDGQVYTRANGCGFRSSHNPESLAIAVRDNDLTLIYDGSNK